MWAARCCEFELEARRGLHVAIDRQSHPATFADIVQAWREDAAFRSLFSRLLAEAPFAAFRWETPPVTSSTVVGEFEFVILDSPALARQPDPEAFAEHFESATDKGVIVIPNLSGDAIMIVPCPLAAPSCYGHLAAFVRGAPDWQQQALWQAVGESMERRIGSLPVWLSTAGGGVSWLHLRLDDRPKYYAFDPYRGR
jgi:hypothetical protein